jgi:hypothetical protein
MPPSQKDELSALGKARERLYASREAAPEALEPLSDARKGATPHTWQAALSPRSFGAPHHTSFAIKFFIAALFFFVAAVGISILLFSTGTNAVSADNVEVVVSGPTTITGGDTVPLSIAITNKNPATISDVTLEVDFPEGTRSAKDVTLAYPRSTEALGELASGGSIERSVSAVLFGGEGAEPKIQIAVSFKTERSNAVLVKRVSYPIAISTAPLSLSVTTVSETVSGKPFTIRVTARSNATQAIEGVVLRAQYPAGFQLQNSSLSPVGTSFIVGRLQPGASKELTLTGILTAENNEERVFHFTIGTAKSANDPTLAVAYMTQQTGLTISAPFLATSFMVNGSSAVTPAVAPGSLVSVRVTWANALAIPLGNASVEVTLSGAALDPASVDVQRGFYRSADKTVIFSGDTDSSLASLSPGATGFAIFTFRTFANAPRNSAVTLAVSINGERVGQSGVPERVTTTSEKVIRLTSSVAFSAAALYASGPLSNTGPVPPRVDTPTTYTVRWNVVNSGNDLADASVSAVLPAYVDFTGVFQPTGDFTYDGASRTVRWRAGDVSGGTTRTGSFQVRVTPSITQRGSTPTLTSQPELSAFDRYAQVQLTARGEVVTTATPEDPGYTPSKAVVQ